uniref:Uncharacterized protein n=1 Tax=Cacopsylla melanoneura TaxID=428564 RepID=A0A8D9FH94_9HEMI
MLDIELGIQLTLDSNVKRNQNLRIEDVNLEMKIGPIKNILGSNTLNQNLRIEDVTLEMKIDPIKNTLNQNPRIKDDTLEMKMDLIKNTTTKNISVESLVIPTLTVGTRARDTPDTGPLHRLVPYHHLLVVLRILNIRSSSLTFLSKV